MNNVRNTVQTVCTAAAAALVLGSCGGGSGSAQQAKPNILFVIMDDVGIDQMASFGYGGPAAPPMPNIEAVAAAGLKFRNTWGMPECSPSRAAFFAGRYPLRTNVNQAIGPNDLANSHVSPYEVTAPKLLKQAGYQSGMFGKFHLAGPENNEAGNATPAVLGWDHFYGWVGGLAGSVDTTAGGVYPPGQWSCGFYPHHFEGSCHYANNSCENMPAKSLDQDSNGLQCATKGGIFVDRHQCGSPLPAGAKLDFNRQNAYYVSPLVSIANGKVEEVALSDPRSRGYRTTIETDAAVQWIKSRPAGQPWMASVSYTSAHTPWQFAPKSLSPRSSPRLSGNVLDCTGSVAGRGIQNQMTEAMDSEFGRLLVETGLAKRAADGSLAYDPKASNTIIVIVGDNGSLGLAVKPPFNASLSKGTSYQTGVWVPLVVAGPAVAQPGREVGHMVNAVDLFQLFGELAGLDVHKAVPRTLDSVAMLPYLTNPAQGSLRTINFAQSGVNSQPNDGRNGPCVLNRTQTAGGACTLIPTQKSVCEDNTGVWWGPGYTDPSVVPNGGAGYARCWQVNQAILKADPAALPVDIVAERSVAVRDERFKIVRNTVINYDPATNGSREDTTTEFYEIDQAAPTPKLEDPSSNDLLKKLPLAADAQKAYDTLSAKLASLLASEPACPGDGNKDGLVNAEDLANWRRIATNWGLSSVYDFLVNNVFDGLTNSTDEQVIQQNMGKTCAKTYSVS